MNQNNYLLKNSILNVWLKALKQSEKYPKFDLVDIVKSAFYDQIKGGHIKKFCHLALIA